MALSHLSAATAVRGSSKAVGATVSTGTALWPSSPAGSAIVVVVAKDNVQTADGATGEISGVTDTRGNSYSKVGEFTNGQGAAGAGATVAIFVCANVATGLVNGVDSITATFSASVAARALTCVLIGKASGATLGWVAGATQSLANDAADPGAMAIAGQASREYLLVRGIASEGLPVAGTPTVGYTAFAGATSTGTSGGGAATNMSAWGELRIISGTGDTSNPQVTTTDSASLFVTLYEQAAVAAIYRGAAGKAVVYRGVKSDAQLYRGANQLWP